MSQRQVHHVAPLPVCATPVPGAMARVTMAMKVTMVMAVAIAIQMGVRGLILEGCVTGLQYST